RSVCRITGVLAGRGGGGEGGRPGPGGGGGGRVVPVAAVIACVHNAIAIGIGSAAGEARRTVALTGGSADADGLGRCRRVVVAVSAGRRQGRTAGTAAA